MVVEQNLLVVAIFNVVVERWKIFSKLKYLCSWN
jgi:hypothetical protein